MDKFFDHPAVRAAYAADEYIPYWSELWPASRMLAKVVLREPWETYPQPVEILEVGCGLGLAGIAALARGLAVTFSDLDETATRFAAANARLNGFTKFRTAGIDLRHPPAGLRVPILLGADLMYEPRMVETLAGFIARVLAPNGVCLIADPDRYSARPFRWTAEQAGLRVTPSLVRAGEPGGERHKGTLYRITKGERPT
jgi:predicted nicotinamide N-methyase